MPDTLRRAGRIQFPLKIGLRQEMSEVYFHDDGTLMNYSDTAFSSEKVEGLRSISTLCARPATSPFSRLVTSSGNRLRSGDPGFVEEFRRQSRLAAWIVDPEEDAFRTRR